MVLEAIPVVTRWAAGHQFITGKHTRYTSGQIRVSKLIMFLGCGRKPETTSKGWCWGDSPSSSQDTTGWPALDATSYALLFTVEGMEWSQIIQPVTTWPKYDTHSWFQHKCQCANTSQLHNRCTGCVCVSVSVGGGGEVCGYTKIAPVWLNGPVTIWWQAVVGDHNTVPHMLGSHGWVTAPSARFLIININSASLKMTSCHALLIGLSPQADVGNAATTGHPRLH